MCLPGPFSGGNHLTFDGLEIGASLVCRPSESRMAPQHCRGSSGVVPGTWPYRPLLATDVNVLSTERLILRRLTTGDAEFIFELLNDPDFLRFIGDKGVRSLDDARGYILSGPVASYAQHGFGLWLVELKGSNTPVGICGLLKRDALDDVDIGFAFLPPLPLEWLRLRISLGGGGVRPNIRWGCGGSWRSPTRITPVLSGCWRRSA